MRHILIICTGNTCRSPMAVRLLEDILKRGGYTGITVGSAGLAAVEGGHPSENARVVMRELDLPIDDYTSHWLAQEDTDNADLILCMTAEHKRLLAESGVDENKIVVLGVCDPFGGDLDSYRKCRDLLINELQNNLDMIRGKKH